MPKSLIVFSHNYLVIRRNGKLINCLLLIVPKFVEICRRSRIKHIIINLKKQLARTNVYAVVSAGSGGASLDPLSVGVGFSS